MRILHSADWHLGSPFTGHSPEQTASLKSALESVPQRVAELALREHCDLMLLAGDLFDREASPDALTSLLRTLGSLTIPVVIAPGNHDFLSPGSPWTAVSLPKNIYIFHSSKVESIAIPHLDCRVYGAAFTGPYCASIPDDFRADCTERHVIGLFHGDPLQTDSPYRPISRAQVQEWGLDYLALGHVHKQGSFRVGDTLCAWPGCPMGRGYDETGPRGVLITDLEKGCESHFVSLDFPAFYRLEVKVEEDPLTALNRLLPAVGNRNYYQVTLTGTCEPPDLGYLRGELRRFPNLTLRDETLPPLDLWQDAGADTLEGVFFGKLRQLPESEQVLLAARICRRLLAGQEVELP